jgi:REP element-mobilizing transposase RayT
LRGYDYDSPSNSFVTICTQNRACLFGDIQDGMLTMSTAGLVMESWWLAIPRAFPEVELDAVVVMPNHVHGILLDGTMADTPGETSLPSLSRVIQRFKGQSTNDYMVGVRTDGWRRFEGRLWQKGYYEHIIRSDREIDRIRDYVDGIPLHWPDDEYNPERMRREPASVEPTREPRTQGAGLPPLAGARHGS